MRTSWNILLLLKVQGASRRGKRPNRLIEHVWREPGERQQALHGDSLGEDEGTIQGSPKGWSREGRGREDGESRFREEGEGQGSESRAA